MGTDSPGPPLCPIMDFAGGAQSWAIHSIGEDWVIGSSPPRASTIPQLQTYIRGPGADEGLSFRASRE